MVLWRSSAMVKPTQEGRSDVHFGYGGGRSWEDELKTFFFFFFKFPAQQLHQLCTCVFMFFFIYLFYFYYCWLYGSNRVSYINMQVSSLKAPRDLFQWE